MYKRQNKNIMNNIRLDKLMHHAIMASNTSSIGRANYARHLEECISNPTLGGIAEQQYLLKSQNRFHKLNPKMRYLIDILNDEKKKLYPKTRKVREYIIQDDRLDLLSVTKRKGYNWFAKLKILLHR